MKIRHGFVSNSSSGSFIFPKDMTIEKVKDIIDKTEKFVSEICMKDVKAGLTEPRIYTMNDGRQRYWTTDVQLVRNGLDPAKFYGCVIADTLKDNSCPFDIHQILQNRVNATYIHYGDAS